MTDGRDDAEIYDGVVYGVTCSECCRGEWFDFESGDTLDKCPYCENQNVHLVEVEECDER